MLEVGHAMAMRNKRCGLVCVISLALLACGSPRVSGGAAEASVRGDAIEESDPHEVEAPAQPSRPCVLSSSEADPPERHRFEGPVIEAPERGTCGGLTALALNHVEQALGDRIRVRLAAGTVDSPPPYGIMGAASAPEQQRVLWLEAGGSRMGFRFQEVLATAGEDMLGYAAARAPEGWTATRLDEQDSAMPGVIVEPDQLVDNAGDVYLSTAWLVDPDGLVIQANGVTSPEIARTGGCVALARRVFTQIRPGQRRLDVSGGVRELEGGLVITLPPGYVLHADEGPDFVVFRVRPVTSLGGDFGHLGVYLGGHPSFHPERSQAAWTSTTLAGELGWYERCEGGMRHAEALAGSTHIFYGASNEELFSTLRRAAESLRNTRPSMP